MDNEETQEASRPKPRAKSTTKPAETKPEALQPDPQTVEPTQPDEKWKKFRAVQDGKIIEARIERKEFKCLRDGLESTGKPGQAHCRDEHGTWALEHRSLQLLYEEIPE